MSDLVKFKKGQSTNLSSTAISPGQILVSTDTGEMHVDYDDNGINKRVKIKDPSVATNYVSKSGDVMTGALYIDATSSSLPNMVSTDTYVRGLLGAKLSSSLSMPLIYCATQNNENGGAGVCFTGKGLTIIGAGEHGPSAILNNAAQKSGTINGYNGSVMGPVSEELVLSSDTVISFYPGSKTDSYASQINTSGTFIGPASDAAIQSGLVTSTWLNGNQGKALVNSTAAAGSLVTLLKSNSTNGYFAMSNHGDAFKLTYTAKTTVDANTNNTTKALVLLNESGNTSFPGTVTVATPTANTHAATKAYVDSHTHTASLATGSTAGTVLAANTKYTLTAGGSTVSFTTPPDNNTDTKVTAVDNHYSPSTVSGQDKTASASGGTAAWNIDVVTGVTLNTDGKGHVTGLSVASGKTPTNPMVYPAAYCTTAAGTAAKAASCTGYTLPTRGFVHINFKNANSSQTALTLNINSTGAKSIYINGSASSASNYTLPAGTYLAYYNGTNYYIETDGKFRSNSLNTGVITSGAITSSNTITANGKLVVKLDGATNISDSNQNVASVLSAQLAGGYTQVPYILTTTANNDSNGGGNGIAFAGGGLTVVAGGDNTPRGILANAAAQSGTSLAIGGSTSYVKPITEELILGADSGISLFLNNTTSPNARFTANTANGVNLATRRLCIGESNSLSHDTAYIIGDGNTVSNYGAALGRGNTVSGENSYALGGWNTIAGEKCFAIGSNNNLDSVAGNGGARYMHRSAALGCRNTIQCNTTTGLTTYDYAYAIGGFNTVHNTGIAIGCNNTISIETTSSAARRDFSVCIGSWNSCEEYNSYCLGYALTNNSNGAFVCGRQNKALTRNFGYTSSTSGDVFVVGNGYSQANSSAETGYVHIRGNAFRVTYTGTVYSKGAYNTSGADYAEFVKEWWDGNPNNEDRVGYMVTVKNGKLYKANIGDHVIGITSGNPSVIGNADEDYFWMYERDEFNRIISEEVPDLVPKLDENGEFILDENEEIIYEDSGNTIKRFKFRENYDPTLQDSYVERKDRPEWDYVGMRGIVPCRDDGTCEEGGFCKCGNNGIATYSSIQDFNTYYVVERISENVVSIEVK